MVVGDLGDGSDSPLIDQLHHAMHLWNEERRGELVSYLRDHDLFEQGPFWKLAQALFEVMPRDEADWKLVSALVGRAGNVTDGSETGGRDSGRRRVVALVAKIRRPT